MWLLFRGREVHWIFRSPCMQTNINWAPHFDNFLNWSAISCTNFIHFHKLGAFKIDFYVLKITLTIVLMNILTRR